MAASELGRRSGTRLSTRYLELSDLDLPPPTGAPDETVDHLKAAFAGADGVFVSSDEYTGTYSTLLRHALMWLARIEGEASALLLCGKPVLVAGMAGQGVNGMRGIPATAHLVERLGAVVQTVRITPGPDYSAVDPEGRLSPEADRTLARALDDWLETWPA